jgi:hypothetical protein
LLVALALSGPAAALASSAGDQQYVDPLAVQPTSSPHPQKKSSTSSPSSSSSSNSSSTQPTSTVTSTSTSTSATPTPAPVKKPVAHKASQIRFNAEVVAVAKVVVNGTGLVTHRVLHAA